MSYGAINYHQIKAARGLLGITRSELAEAIHTHEQYLDAVERDYELDDEIRANVTVAAVEELERRGVEFVSTVAGSYGVAYRMPGDNEILDALDDMLGNGATRDEGPDYVTYGDGTYDGRPPEEKSQRFGLTKLALAALAFMALVFLLLHGCEAHLMLHIQSKPSAEIGSSEPEEFDPPNLTIAPVYGQVDGAKENVDAGDAKRPPEEKIADPKK